MARSELGIARRYRRHKKIEWLPRVDVEDLLEICNVDHVSRARSDEMKFSCPFGGHKAADSTPSAYMNTGELDSEKATQWKCHGCGRQGNAITFVAELQDISNMEAINWLRNEYAKDFRSPRGGSISAEFEMRRQKFESKRKRPSIDPVLSDDTLEQFSNDWPTDWAEWLETKSQGPVGYMFNRGFEPETLMDWQIGWDDISERFTIPVRNHRGKLVGFKARTWDKDVKPKYKVIGGRRYDFQTFEKTNHLFGLHRADRSYPTCIVIEGELNVMAMEQMGFVNAVGIAGSSMSDKQAKLIRDHFTEAIVFLDWDLAGHRATWGYVDKDGDEHPGIVDMLEPFMSLKLVGKHRHDPADYMRLKKGGFVAKLLRNARASTQFIEVPAPPE